MIDPTLTPKQERLINYLISHSFNNLSADEVQEIISGMTAQAITECLDEARTRLEGLKATGLGRELL